MNAIKTEAAEINGCNGCAGPAKKEEIGHPASDAYLFWTVPPHGRWSTLMLRKRSSLAVQLASYLLAVLALSMCLGQASADKSARDELPEVFDKFLPEGVQDLKAIQQQVKKVVDRVLPCTVGLLIGQAQGSGVIIDKEGHILTAAHVSGEAGRPCMIILPDGKKLKGVTLGANVGIDSGLVTIAQPGVEFPHIDMGHSSELRKGQWVVAVGHPGGWQQGRQPVVRVGRILESTPKHIRTDCTLVGGDSGGPLFDMYGDVVGIHSRIGGSITFNIHVPIDTYTETWDRLAASEVWGSPFSNLAKAKQAGDPYLGVRPDPDARPFKIVSVTPGSPAAKAGLLAEDVIVRVDDRPIASISDFDNAIRSKTPGVQVTLEVRRGDEVVTITVTLGRRPME
jgi:serine protease Do